MKPSIAFVGAGPTTIYTLNALLEHSQRPFALTIFEEQAVAGRGTPYRPGWNDPAMLSNIASIEIPPLTETLVAWLERQSEARLTNLGVDPGDIGERIFYPRLALGAFFQDQFQALVNKAKTQGVEIEVRTRSRVSDAVSRPAGVVLSIEAEDGSASQARFDHLVLATGHQWPEHPEVRPGYFLSPWPASALGEIGACSVGIRGSSLTAIDAAVALALSHGAFVETPEDRLAYAPKAGSNGFHLTMLSRKGLLPEADFFHPIPYEPLTICTPEAVERLIGERGDLLDETFALFKAELTAADPSFATRVKLRTLEIEGFCDRYFSERMAVDTFVWAKTNLKEAERNFEERITVPWRYAILRMHEVVGLIVPHLDEVGFARFSRYFKPIFVDEYATVPHDSIKRMLALHQAGRLDILAVGEDYKVDSRGCEPGAVVRLGDQQWHFPVFVEAVGQRPLKAKDFPFPSLLKQGIIRDETSADGQARGIVIDDQFHPISDEVPPGQLFCLSLPFILGRHPFIQGITSSHEIGSVVGKELASIVDQSLQNTSNADAGPESLAR